MEKKPLLIGEAPSGRETSLDPLVWRKPLFGSCALTLCELMGMGHKHQRKEEAYDLLTSRFTCENAIERYESAYPWDARVRAEAEARVERLIWTLEPEEIICLGRNTAEAAGLAPDHVWGEWNGRVWVPDGGEPFVYAITVIPHPSGLNRLYNDPSMRDLAHKVLTESS